MRPCTSETCARPWARCGAHSQQTSRRPHNARRGPSAPLRAGATSPTTPRPLLLVCVWHRCCSRPPSDPLAAAAKPDTRKARSALALSQISRLGANRRAGGLAKGSFPSGQRTAQPARGPSERPEGALKITREAYGPAQPRTDAPPGVMARAPARLRLSRPPSSADSTSSPGNATVGSRRGPNLRAREGKQRSTNANDKGPKRRTKDDSDEGAVLNPADVKLDSVLSDGMVQHLLRLQRGEWDRKPYVPKYAPGSFEASQLVHAGRELFRGEAPPVKIWGMLEKRIGVVGMHNAEAHLKVRRVPVNDGLGERRQHFESGDVELKPRDAKTSVPAAALAQAAAASVPAPKQTAAVR